jgi:Ca-activated chloride channel family protein
LIHGGAVLGYGTTDGGTMTVYNPLYEEMEVVKEDGYYGNIKAVSKMNPDNLESIASDFGVEYIHMRKTENIDDTLDEILNGVSTSYEDEKTKGFAETYFWFAIPMGILLIYEYIEFKRKV